MRKKRIFVTLLIILAIITLYIVGCIISNYLYENSKIIIDSYDTNDTKMVSISELENIVKVKFTNDSIENPEIDLKSSGENGVSMGDWVAAPNTFVDICYEISKETLNDREYYKETSTDTIKGISNFDYEILNIIDKNNIDEDQVEYVNIKYGTCSYDITNGVNYADYYFYVIFIKITDQKYKVLISGEYPYPIELK